MNITGVKIKNPRSSASIFKHVEDYRDKTGIFVQLFDHDKVVGREHLSWAYEKASYCMKMETNRGDTIEMETLLWASGYRQIKNAIDKMGLQDNANKAVVMVGDDLEAFLEYMGWERDDPIIEPSIDKLLAFGITMGEIETTDRPYDLIFEYMATSVV